MRLFDGDRETRTVQVPNGATSIRFSTDGKTLHVGSHDVDAAGGRCDHRESAVAFHPTRPVLAVANHDGHVRIYGVADGQLAKPPLLLDKDVGGDIRGIAFGAGGPRTIHHRTAIRGGNTATFPMQRPDAARSEPSSSARRDLTRIPRGQGCSDDGWSDPW